MDAQNAPDIGDMAPHQAERGAVAAPQKQAGKLGRRGEPGRAAEQ